MPFTLYSTDYLDGGGSSAVASIPEAIYTEMLELHSTQRLFARVYFSSGPSRYTAVQPCANGEETPIYMPLWMIPDGEPMGQVVEVIFRGTDAFPQATAVSLKPTDSAFYSTDIKETLTQQLTQLGILRVGDMIQLTLDEMGGYPIEFYVSKCDPTDVVLLDGEEIVVDYEEATDVWDGRPLVERAPTPIPPEPLPLVQGNLLGGGPVRRMADGRSWNPYR
jgi:hypothetical protein